MIDKDELGDRFFRFKQSKSLGLVQIYAYHCHRCNYTWLPRSFDYSTTDNNSYGNCDLFFREPPKCCARCKSKYWKSQYMQRKNNKVRTDTYGRIKEAVSKTRYRAITIGMKSNKELFDVISERPGYALLLIRDLERRRHPPQDLIAEIKKAYEQATQQHQFGEEDPHMLSS